MNWFYIGRIPQVAFWGPGLLAVAAIKTSTLKNFSTLLKFIHYKNILMVYIYNFKMIFLTWSEIQIKSKQGILLYLYPYIS